MGESLEVRVARLEEQMKSHDAWLTDVAGSLRSINNWLRGLAGSVILALILLVANLLVGQGRPTVARAVSSSASPASQGN